MSQRTTRRSEKTSGKKAQKPTVQVKAIFDSTKNGIHGAHGIGCRN